MSKRPCALITGSSNGIGAAIAREFARLDYALVLTGRNQIDLASVARDCAELSPSKTKPLAHVAELGNDHEVASLFEVAMSHFDHKLHVLVNNAGLAEVVPHTQPAECYAAYKRTMAVNLDSAVHLSLLCAEPLRRGALQRATRAAEHDGDADHRLTPTPSVIWPENSTIITSCIINMGSVAGQRATLGRFAYGCTKAGLASITRSLAVELAPHVRVNCIEPGPIDTNILDTNGPGTRAAVRTAAELVVPLARIGQPHEVARCVAFLADPALASYITGASLTVDGGASLALAGAPPAH